jgi:hypothetical protein
MYDKYTDISIYLSYKRKMKSELEIFLYTKNETIAKLSKELGINDKTLSNKLKGKREFKASEIRILSEKFHLSDEEIVRFFSLKNT